MTRGNRSCRTPVRRGAGGRPTREEALQRDARLLNVATVRGVAILLRQFAARDEIKVDDPELTADLFLNLLLGHTARLAIHGVATDPELLERRAGCGRALLSMASP
jgi:hypothetical protein